MQNTNKQVQLCFLFKKFINDSKTGRRLQKNGREISKSTLNNYKSVLKNLEGFSGKTGGDFQINIRYKNSKSSFLRERNRYWNFYSNYKAFLYDKGCMDNYVCLNIKVLRTFFNFLIVTKGYEIGGFFKEFYSRHEEIPIIVLNNDQLRFLIKNQDFELKLSKNQLIIKDILVIGCTVGLRFSDLMALQIKNIEEINCCTYIVTKSIKTKTFTRVKVPNYVIELIEKYKLKHKRLLPSFSLNYFNQQLKLIGEIAGWTYQTGKCRSKKGYQKEIIKTDGKEYRFCDLLSSHVMRRTAITTMLNFGMPETLVRRISGHTANSAEFYKYVKYSEAFIDSETDKVFEKLNA